MTKTRKTLEDCQADAVILHGLAQAVDELDLIANSEKAANKGRPCPASNAVTCVNHVLIEKAQQLADDLDALETGARR